MISSIYLLGCLAVMSGAPPAPPSDTVVLMYHQVAEVALTEARQYVMPLSRLEAQLGELRDQGYQTLDADRYVRHLSEGNRPQGKNVILTFDDAHDSDWKLVAPLLERYGFRGLFFPTGRQLKGNTAKRYRELVSRGHQVGSHTMNHYYLTKKGSGRTTCGRKTGCTEADIRDELKTSRERLAAVIAPTTLLAWPGNYYDERTIRIARGLGYRGLFAVEKQVRTEDGVLVGLPGKTTSPDEIFRVEIDGRCSMDEFRRAVQEHRGCVHSSRSFHRHFIPQSPPGAEAGD